MLSWKAGGLLLGAVFLMAVVLVKPIGVSTQFVIFDAIVWDMFDDSVIVEAPEAKSGYASTNAYLNKSDGKYAKSAANPDNYSFIFVVAMIIGAGVSGLLRGGVGVEQRIMPEIWKANFGDKPALRYAMAFAAGFLVLYGARLAGGCTSGHMMSGMMQTAVSGYIFALGAFGAAIPTALILFKKKEG